MGRLEPFQTDIVTPVKGVDISLRGTVMASGAPDNRITTSDGSTLFIWRDENGKTAGIQSLDAEGELESLAFFKDGKFHRSPTEGPARFIRTENGSELQWLVNGAHPDAEVSPALQRFDSRGRSIETLGHASDGSLTAYDAPANKQREPVAPQPAVEVEPVGPHNVVAATGTPMSLTDTIMATAEPSRKLTTPGGETVFTWHNNDGQLAGIQKFDRDGSLAMISLMEDGKVHRELADGPAKFVRTSEGSELHWMTQGDYPFWAQHVAIRKYDENGVAVDSLFQESTSTDTLTNDSELIGVTQERRDKILRIANASLQNYYNRNGIDRTVSSETIHADQAPYQTDFRLNDSVNFNLKGTVMEGAPGNKSITGEGATVFTWHDENGRLAGIQKFGRNGQLENLALFQDGKIHRDPEEGPAKFVRTEEGSELHWMVDGHHPFNAEHTAVRRFDHDGAVTESLFQQSVGDDLNDYTDDPNKIASVHNAANLANEVGAAALKRFDQQNGMVRDPSAYEPELAHSVQAPYRSDFLLNGAAVVDVRDTVMESPPSKRAVTNDGSTVYTWLNDQGRLAGIQKFGPEGQLESLAFFENGKIHRPYDEGPAKVTVEDGKPTLHWMEDGHYPRYAAHKATEEYDAEGRLKQTQYQLTFSGDLSTDPEHIRQSQEASSTVREIAAVAEERLAENEATPAPGM